MMCTLPKRFTPFACRAALLILSTASLHVLSGASIRAEVPTPNVTPSTDPNDKPGEFLNFVGHYGEVLKFRSGWEIRASMHGEAEVINHFPKIRILPSGAAERFEPTAEDFVPENFTKDELIQLIILPWSASSSKNLRELKRLKILDLKSSGVDYRIVDNPFPGFGHMGRKWPEGTFEVFIATPYRLTQLYTTSGSHLAILTAGVDTPPSNVITRYSDIVRMGLRDWIVPETGDEIPQTFGPVPAKNDPVTGVSLNVFRAPKVRTAWAAITGIALLFLVALSLMRIWPPLRRAILSLLLFSHMGAFIGFLVGLCFWPFPRFSAHLAIPCAVACLFMPLAAWLMGRVRRRCPRRRAMVAAAIFGLSSSAFFVYVALGLNTGEGNSPHIAAYTAIFVFPFYAICGVIFGFLDSNKNERGFPKLAVTIMLLAAAPGIWAQPVSIDKGVPKQIEPPLGDAVFRARQRLAEHGITRDDFEERARKNLSQTEILYDYQRVEIKGILAKDDTNKAIKDLFDMQIEPSHLGENKDRVIAPPAWMREAFNGAKDFKDLRADAFGAFSKTAIRAVAQLKDQEVNEIVAHSWGTEIVYNAILARDIKAPRRLIVCGMPDRDMAKWVALSKHTGTEVVVYANSRDPAARAARIVGGVIEGVREAGESSAERIARERIANKYLENSNSGEFEARWEAACKLKPCNPHGRQPAAPNFDYAYKAPTHSRLGYYEAMIKDKVIPFADSDAVELGKRQNAKVAAEIDRLYAAAVEREVVNENPEAGGQSSDLSFLGSLQQGAAKIDDMRRDARKAHAERMADLGTAVRRREELKAYERSLKDAEDRRRRSPWGALHEWTGKACTYMTYAQTIPLNTIDMSPATQFSREFRSMQEENDRRELEKVRADVLIKEYLLSHSVVMPRSEIAAGRARDKALSSCQESILDMILDAPNPIDSKWLVAQLDAKRDYKRGGGALGAIIRGIASDIGRGAGALVEGLKAPFVSDGSDSGGDDRRSGSSEWNNGPRGAEPERPTRMPDVNGEAMRQLRGIARGGGQF